MQQMPNYIAFKKVPSVLVYKFSTVCHPGDNPQEEQGKI